MEEEDNQLIQEPAQPGPIILKNNGKLKFTEVPSLKQRMHMVTHISMPVTHKAANKNIILTKHGKEFKIYQIIDKKIKFVSQHKVELPVDEEFFSSYVTGRRIRFIVTNNFMKKNPKNMAFYKKNGISTLKLTKLVFECEFGVGSPEVIRADYLGCFKIDYDGYSYWKVVDMFDNQKPLFGRPQILAKAYESYGEEYFDYRLHEHDRMRLFIAELDPKSKNLIKRTFYLNTDFSGLDSYQQKLEADKRKLGQEYLSRFQFLFDGTKLQLENQEPGLPQVVKPFIQIDEWILTVGLINWRSKKIPVRAFVSFYELLQNLDFLKVARLTFSKLMKAHYCYDVDTLSLEMWIDLEYKPKKEYKGEEESRILEGQIAAGCKERYNLSFFRFERRVLTETKRLRFTVSNVLKGGDRRIEVRNIGYSTKNGVLSRKGSLIEYEEDRFNFRIHLKSYKGQNDDSPKYEFSGEKTKKKFTKKTQRVLTSSQSVQQEVINVDMFKMALESRVADYRIESIFKLEDNLILIPFSRKMILLDLSTKRVLSSLIYKKNLPVDLNDTIMLGDLLATYDPEQGIIEVLRAIRHPRINTYFKSIRRIDLRGYSYFHSLRSLIAFTHSGEEKYDIRVLAHWRLSQETAFTEPMTLIVKIDLQKNDEAPNPFLDCSIEMFRFRFDKGTSDKIQAFKKGKNWFYYAPLMENIRVCKMEKFYPEEAETKTIYFPLLAMTPGRERELVCSHAGDEVAYLVFGGYAQHHDAFEDDLEDPGKHLMKVGFQTKDSNGFLDDPEIVQAMELPESAQVFFDEKTDKFRIFVFTENDQKESLKLSVRGRDLEVESEYVIEGVLNVVRFSVIDEDWVYISGGLRRFLLDFHVEGRKSLALNLRLGTVVELVGEGGEGLFGVPNLCFGDRLIALTKNHESMVKSHAQGIFISDSVA